MGYFLIKFGHFKDSIFITVCCHLTYTFQSESTLYSSLNVKELLACWNWNFCDCNWNRTHNHLVHKWTLDHLAKPFWQNSWVFIYKLSGPGFQSSCSHSTFIFCLNVTMGKNSRCVNGMCNDNKYSQQL